MADIEDTETRISQILFAFKFYDGEYKKEEIESAIELKDEITPHLINILEELLADPEKYVENNDFYDHIYATMLLGYFKEPKAHKVIADIFSLPDRIVDPLFGDVITENLPTVLYNTSAGSLDQIKEMILNKEANDFCRGSACQALAYAVIGGHISREGALEFIEPLFSGEEAQEGSFFWSSLASTSNSLYPEEIIDTIQQAYETGLIDPIVIGFKDIEHTLRLGKNKCLEELAKKLERRNLDDMHEAMSWWACFNETKTRPSFSDLIDFSEFDYNHAGSNTPKKQKSKTKKKRKQAKASRKKNRK